MLTDYLPLFNSLVTLAVGVGGWIIAVDRNRKANLRNENEKFRRDLNLKTADEIIELLYQIRKTYTGILAIAHRYEQMIKGKEDYQSFNESLWGVIEKGYILADDLIAYYQKRQIVLANYFHDIDGIRITCRHIDKTLWEFKNIFEAGGRTDDELKAKLRHAVQKSKDVIDSIDALLRSLQYDFLGEIYSNNN